jgi:hypothetical protein
MSYRELTMIEIKEVLRRWSPEQSLHHIARETGLDRKTVRRYVQAAESLAFERRREFENGSGTGSRRVLLSDVTSAARMVSAPVWRVDGYKAGASACLWQVAARVRLNAPVARGTRQATVIGVHAQRRTC